ncbi:pleckstrin homology domain-containing family G member 5-like isoform X3 [Neocloeon triangulifer]|uniref:pleckstrin homology domain-containing family G member 5-like isoform X3 n=1 Tax=Neocloeon triangulifer TaxID=2078957 RepID=UPI00286FA4A3|nr:pleckstrin homology domain-containing family G member 5-like isoform X3 [Neocloeon triangulifer]
MAEHGGGKLKSAVKKLLAKSGVRLQGGFDLSPEDEVKDTVGDLPLSENGIRRADMGRRSSLQRAHSFILDKGAKAKGKWNKFSSSTLDLSTLSSHDLEMQVTKSGRLRLGSAPSCETDSEKLAGSDISSKKSHKFDKHESGEKEKDTTWSSEKKRRSNKKNHRLKAPANQLTNSSDLCLNTTQSLGEEQQQARSRSLTHLDALDGARVGEAGSRSAGGTAAVPSTDASPCATPARDFQADALEAAAALLRQPSGMDDFGMDLTRQRLLVPSTDASRDRRRTLARSQVSSSEFFSISFEGVEVDENLRTEFIPASKGVLLVDALGEACDRRKLEINSMDVFLDTNRKPLHISAVDTLSLGGKHLLICAKGSGPTRLARNSSTASQPSSRKTSGGSYKGKGSRGFFSASTEDAPSAADQHGHFEFKLSKQSSSKQPWSSIFGATKQQQLETKSMDLLVDQLNIFSRFGYVNKSCSVPSSMSSSTCDHDRFFLNLYDMEDDWRELVHGCEELSEKIVQQQTAIWELVQTELSYIHILGVVRDLFIACLRHLQAENLLEHVDPSRLFSNISDIYLVNVSFWLNHIQPMVDRSRATKQLLNPSLMLPGFLKFDELFAPYTRYCSDQQDQCQQYCRENMQTSELFMAYLAWCEAQRECKRLRLLDILVKPMQRLTKYSLLLKAILKNTDDTDQRMDLLLMIKHVDHFVSSVNTSLRMQQDEEKLRLIAARVNSYEVMQEIKDEDLEKLVKAHSDLNLNTPMPGCTSSQFRQLLFEGGLILKEHAKSKVVKTEVHGLLFTDILLLCKVTNAGKKQPENYKVVRQPFVVDRLQMVEIVRDSQPGLGVVYLNEYQTAVAAFTLFSNDKATNIKVWAEKIRKTQHAYKQAKSAAKAAETAAALAAGMMHPDMTDDGIEDVNHYLAFSSRSQSSSRMLSLNHSQSESMEITDASSFNHSRGVSLEMEAGGRGSSLSSDEGSSGGELKLTFTPPHATSPSPRIEKRSPMRSPNMLGVHHLRHGGGQSLPNLSLSESPSSGLMSPVTLPQQGTNSLLSVPTGKGLSPQRGVSYPPPSPRALRRSYAVPQSRNPPLLKSRHVLGVRSANEAEGSVDVPQIAEIPPPKESCSSSYLKSEEESPGARAYRQVINSKRQVRGSDVRRYHTAGVIDDLKQFSLDPPKKLVIKDTSIHKRLSWNCGAGSAGMQPLGSCARNAGISADSVQSSSGVSSSTGSQAMLYQNEILEIKTTPPAEPPSPALPALKVCPATPLLKAVEDELGVSEGDVHLFSTVEDIVEAFNLEVIQGAANFSENEPYPETQPLEPEAMPAITQPPRRTECSLAGPPPAVPPRSRNNSATSEKNDLCSNLDSTDV